jgi:hypothetical protein
LKSTPSNYGIEFDVREGVDGIVVTHDPWSPSLPIEEFLSCVSHSFYIVNIKSEGIEDRMLDLLKKYRIDDYFLLDCSFPAIVRLSKRGERSIAIRVSEYETPGSAILMKKYVDWVWLDSFERLPSAETCDLLRTQGFKVCLVSPELQGRTESAIHLKGHIDAVCTKSPTSWY